LTLNDTIQVLYKGAIRFFEVKFFFHASIARVQETLALGSMYSPVDNELKIRSYGALNVCNHVETPYVVIKANSILSVVAMVPFEENTSRFFLVEKFALGVVHTDGNVDDES